jgi:hypothetical protein
MPRPLVTSSLRLSGRPPLQRFQKRRHRVTTAAACNQHQSADHQHIHGEGCGHETVQHGDHVDYVHDGHWHAGHEGHYDEHGDTD